MKVIVVSGFLGSGKTRFIETFSKRLDNLAILENDYARADIDSEILRSSADDIYSLENGCICCSREADFATTLITISNGVNPDYLIIEPTGLGYLSKLLNNIRSISYDRIEILDPITLVDYHTLEENLKNYEELFIDQLKNAGHILLSKIENVSEKDVSLAVDKIKKYTKAPVYYMHYSTFEEEDWDRLFSSYDYDRLDLNDAANLALDSLSFEDVFFDDFHSLGSALNAVTGNRFGKLLRGKGIIKVEDKTVRVDIVNGTFDVKKYSGTSLGKMVFIGEGLEKKAFEILFKNKKKI